MDVAPTLAALGITSRLDDGELIARSPIDGSITARLPHAAAAEVTAAVGRAQAAFEVRNSTAADAGQLRQLFLRQARGLAMPL